MSNEGIPIVRIEWDGILAKREDAPSWQGKWRQPIVYVLEDGRRFPTGESFRLKRDAVAFAATLPCAPDHPTTAMFDEDGRFYGTRMSFYIGPRR